jgi:site-specific DNA recombinase
VPTTAIYARTASRSQVSTPLTQQLGRLRDYCSQHEITDVIEFVDDGVSGMLPLDERSGGSKLLSVAKERGLELLLVEGLDRIARDQQTLKNTLDALANLGIAVQTTT